MLRVSLRLHLDVFDFEKKRRVVRTLRAPERWQTHDADRVMFQLCASDRGPSDSDSGDDDEDASASASVDPSAFDELRDDPDALMSVVMAQHPRELSRGGDSGLGVAACVWDGALILASLLAYAALYGPPWIGPAGSTRLRDAANARLRLRSALDGLRVVELGTCKHVTDWGQSCVCFVSFTGSASRCMTYGRCGLWSGWIGRCSAGRPCDFD
jgi:hypothetical protein